MEGAPRRESKGCGPTTRKKKVWTGYRVQAMAYGLGSGVHGTTVQRYPDRCKPVPKQNREPVSMH